eukprot:4386739-Pyramimonas_sp.AAC.1
MGGSPHEQIRKQRKQMACSAGWGLAPLQRTTVVLSSCLAASSLAELHLLGVAWAGFRPEGHVLDDFPGGPNHIRVCPPPVAGDRPVHLLKY